MADAQEQVAEGQQDQQQQVDDQFAAADAAGAVAEPEAPSIEELASEMGWMPKEKFRGEEAEWKPAHEFIRTGKDIQRSTARELKELRGTVDTIAKTSASILQQRLAEERAELAAKYEKAVDSGDHDAAFKTATEIIRIDERAQHPQRSAPAPEAIEWGQRNQRLMSDALAAQRAVELCEPYARAGKTAAEQLAAAEPILRREFPHLFDAAAETKPPPGVSQPGSRMNGTTRKTETYADLPKEAKTVADDMVERGLIKADTPQAAKEMYARNYFAQLRKGQ
jgi:hypothetical protein